jgi:transketolase
MSNKYELWYNDVNIAKNTLQSERFNSIVDFIQNGIDGLHFSSSNFKIQSDYNEELRESNSKIMNIVSERSKFFLGGSADLSSSCHTSLYKEIDHTKKERRLQPVNIWIKSNMNEPAL